MKNEEELKLRTLMNTLKGYRVPTERKGNNFVVEIMVQKTEEEDNFPKQKRVATKRRSTA